MSNRPMLTIPRDSYLQRIAWFELEGHRVEAFALKLVAPYFEPPLRVDEGEIQRYKETLRKTRAK